MNAILLKTLSERCKDMGLTDKAISRLAELGSEGFGDEPTEDEVSAKVDSLIPFAQAMQAEITRKTRKSQQPQPTESSSKSEGEGEGVRTNGDVMPDWARAMQEQLNGLKAENDTLKASAKAQQRASQITQKAKVLGIPDYLVSRLSFADDADIDKELESFKQDLVNNNLVPKGTVNELGGLEEQMKAEAKSWAESLPDK